MDKLLDNISWVIPIVIIIFFLFRYIKNKSFKGMLFGAEIIKSLDAVEGKSIGPMKASIRVHLLKNADTNERLVGLELVTKSFASYQMTPVSLSLADAKALARLIRDATNSH